MLFRVVPLIMEKKPRTDWNIKAIKVSVIFDLVF